MHNRKVSLNAAMGFVNLKVTKYVWNNTAVSQLHKAICALWFDYVTQ